MQEKNIGFITEDEAKEISTKREYTYQLAYPVELGDIVETEVTLKRFKGRQIKEITKIKDEFEAGLKMIELSSGLSHLVVEDIEFTDLQNLMEICSVFMDASHRKKA